jgi:hypothetical protein
MKTLAEYGEIMLPASDLELVVAHKPEIAVAPYAAIMANMPSARTARPAREAAPEPAFKRPLDADDVHRTHGREGAPMKT